jgi:hypothetical protein
MTAVAGQRAAGDSTQEGDWRPLPRRSPSGVRDGDLDGALAAETRDGNHGRIPGPPGMDHAVVGELHRRLGDVAGATPCDTGLVACIEDDLGGQLRGLAVCNRRCRQQREVSTENPRHSEVLRVELAGLEPATAWVRSNIGSA